MKVSNLPIGKHGVLSLIRCELIGIPALDTEANYESSYRRHAVAS
jgi:hypothetical protein